MGLLENFKRVAREYELISKYDGNMVDEDDIIYDLYFSILRQDGCSSKSVLEDEGDIMMFIIKYVRTRHMISIFELLSCHYLIRKKAVDEIFNEMNLI